MSICFGFLDRSSLRVSCRLLPPISIVTLSSEKVSPCFTPCPGVARSEVLRRACRSTRRDHPLAMNSSAHYLLTMRIIDPQTGRTYVEKRRRRYNEANQPRELTFSCFHRYPFLGRERTREWFREALEAARTKIGFQIWAYVLMPDHVHLLIYPSDAPQRMSRFLQAVKEPVARRAIAHLKASAPAWLDRLRVQEGKRVRHRFWQPGGGYDRNVTSSATLRAMIDYLH